MVKWNLSEKGESGSHATFVGDIYEFWEFFIDIVTHLIGESDKIELVVVKIRNDGVAIMMIVIVALWKKNDIFGLHNELIGSANIFVEFVDWEFGILEERDGIKFHSGRNHKTVFFEHCREGLWSSEGLLGVTMIEVSSFARRVDFFERTDGYFGIMFMKGGEHGVNHVWFYGVV